MNTKRKCKCCGKYTLDKNSIYDICSNCGWESDLVQEDNPNFEGGANELSLNQYKKEYDKRKKCIGKVKYVGKSFGVEGLTNNKVYDVVSVEYPFFRIIDDSGEDYLYSIIKPSSLDNASLCGKWQLIEDNKGLLKDYFKYTSYEEEIQKRLSEYIHNETKIISGMSEKEEWDYIKNEHKNEQIKTIYDDLKEKYDNMEKALNKAHDLLNDKSLCILKYAETTDYYLFEYGTKDKKPLFDDTLIKVDKTNFVASYYNIVEHLKEVNNLVFIEIK